MKKYKVLWRDFDKISIKIIEARHYQIEDGVLFFYRSVGREGGYFIGFSAGSWIFFEVLDDNE